MTAISGYGLLALFYAMAVGRAAWSNTHALSAVLPRWHDDWCAFGAAPEIRWHRAQGGLKDEISNHRHGSCWQDRGAPLGRSWPRRDLWRAEHEQFTGDTGPLSASRVLEPLALIWITVPAQQKRGVAFERNIIRRCMA